MAQLQLDHLTSTPASTVQFNGQVLLEEPEKFEIGVWGCSVGTWVRATKPFEFCYFISGSGTYTGEDGAVYKIRPDSGFTIRPNSKGTWNVTEDLRKIYAVFYD